MMTCFADSPVEKAFALPRNLARKLGKNVVYERFAMTLPDAPPPDRLPQGVSPEKYARLRAEAKAPYRGLRQVVYLTAGASAAIGAFIMITQGLAGRATDDLVPNLLIQFGVLGTVGLLLWLENRGRSKER
jgi:hypothetical protein